ncbi:MAG: antibiotic biosynthesis monooxygenase family protein [Bacteroidota bacterium]
MLIRIVKLTFKPENIASFEHIFESSKHSILEFSGCNLLELYQDINHPNIFFTYSFWENESYLEAYRNSSLFKGIWQDTKVLFAEKPEAWSVNKRQSSNNF